jgi:hypothetical protein
MGLDGAVLTQLHHVAAAAGSRQMPTAPHNTLARLLNTQTCPMNVNSGAPGGIMGLGGAAQMRQRHAGARCSRRHRSGSTKLTQRMHR